MKNTINYFLVGIGWGSFIYLVNLLIFAFDPTWSNSLVTWLASGLMGISALIYKHPKWNDTTKMLLHIGAIYFLVISMIFVNGWIPFDLGYLLGVTCQFIVIYLVIALFFAWQNKGTASKINQKLKERKINLDKR